MRNTFINHLDASAASPEIDPFWIVAGDLGYSVLDNFAKKYPNRYLNAGVAEQNLTGLSAGLALEGTKVFTYSIANFPTFRCLEQIRNDICYHNLDVKVVSVGAGVAYGTHGYTHYGMEDLSIMRPLPNIKLLCPADPFEAIRCADLCLRNNSPMYVRLGKNGEPSIHSAIPEFKLGDMIPLVEDADVLVFATGSICYWALEAVNILRSKGKKVGCVSVPSLKPFNLEQLKSLSSKARQIIAIEEHVPIGGLFSLICESLQLLGVGLKVSSIALPETINILGNQNFILSELGMKGEALVSRIEQLLKF